MQQQSGSFGKSQAASYDHHQLQMAPLYDNLHFLIKAVLNDVPKNAKILSIGVGTGTEIIKLAERYPEFTFVAVEPAAEMLAICRERLKESNLESRCQLVHGLIGEVEEGAFDAALCLLVTHHTSEEERKKILSGMAKRLKDNGLLILAEISYDKISLLEKWQSVVRLSGAPEESVQKLPMLFKEHLSIFSPEEVEKLLKSSGFEDPIQFFQSILIRAWYAKKKV